MLGGLRSSWFDGLKKTICSLKTVPLSSTSLPTGKEKIENKYLNLSGLSGMNTEQLFI